MVYCRHIELVHGVYKPIYNVWGPQIADISIKYRRIVGHWNDIPAMKPQALTKQLESNGRGHGRNGRTRDTTGISWFPFVIFWWDVIVFLWLVGGLEHFFPNSWDDDPIWLIFFRGLKPPIRWVFMFFGGDFMIICGISWNSPPARWGLLDFIRVVLLLLG